MFLHLCSPAPTWILARLHAAPFRVWPRNDFYTSVRANSTQGSFHHTPPSVSTSTAASWNFCHLCIILFLCPGHCAAARFLCLQHTVQSQLCSVKERREVVQEVAVLMAVTHTFSFSSLQELCACFLSGGCSTLPHCSALTRCWADSSHINYSVVPEPQNSAVPL